MEDQVSHIGEDGAQVAGAGAAMPGVEGAGAAGAVQAHMGGSAGAAETAAAEYDYTFVDATARVAVYDDLLSSPQIIDIEPDTTREFINNLATTVYNSAKLAGGTIPYSIILQVAENFIHSQFQEMVVSVLDGGNTIRFSDQGPGIPDKEKAQQPGYSSATAPMKRYINGVGSGLPIVREYMETKHGTVRIEDNMNAGAVVTISLNPAADAAAGTANATGAPLPYANASATVGAVGAVGGTAVQGQAAQPQGQAAATYMQVQPFPVAQATGAPFGQPSTAAAVPFVTAVENAPAGDPMEVAMGMLSQRALQIIKLFVYEDIWGVKDIADETQIPTSSTYSELKKLEEAGMMTRLGKKYRLTELGERVAQNLS